MLFSTRFHEPIRRGDVTLTFRRWKRPQARTGGRYRLHSGGVIEVTGIDVVEAARVTEEEARRAGYSDREGLLRDLDRYEPTSATDEAPEVYRIAFRYAGEMPDERALLAADGDLSEGDREEIEARLARMDGGERGAWTRDLLRLIGASEGVRAADLAARVGRETLRFKADVRRLKTLGLTESLEVGYRLSPRGRAFLGGASGEAPAPRSG